MTELVVAPEMAEVEFTRWAQAWDLDLDLAKMSDEDKLDFEAIKAKMVRAISEGRMVFGDDETLSYTMHKPVMSCEAITFSEPTGACYIAMDRYKDKQSAHKMNAFMAEMTKQPIQVFSKMSGRDLKMCQAVTALFFGA